MAGSGQEVHHSATQGAVVPCSDSPVSQPYPGPGDEVGAELGADTPEGCLELEYLVLDVVPLLPPDLGRRLMRAVAAVTEVACTGVEDGSGDRSASALGSPGRADAEDASQLSQGFIPLIRGADAELAPILAARRSAVEVVEVSTASSHSVARAATTGSRKASVGAGRSTAELVPMGSRGADRNPERSTAGIATCVGSTEATGREPLQAGCATGQRGRSRSRDGTRSNRSSGQDGCDASAADHGDTDFCHPSPSCDAGTGGSSAATNQGPCRSATAPASGGDIPCPARKARIFPRRWEIALVACGVLVGAAAVLVVTFCFCAAHREPLCSPTSALGAAAQSSPAQLSPGCANAVSHRCLCAPSSPPASSPPASSPPPAPTGCVGSSAVQLSSDCGVAASAVGLRSVSLPPSLGPGAGGGCSEVSAISNAEEAPAGAEKAPAGAEKAPTGAEEAPAGAEAAPTGAEKVPAGQHSLQAGSTAAVDLGCQCSVDQEAHAEMAEQIKVLRAALQEAREASKPRGHSAAGGGSQAAQLKAQLQLREAALSAANAELMKLRGN